MNSLSSGETARRLQLLLRQLGDPNTRFPECPALAEDVRVYQMPDGIGVSVHGAHFPVRIRTDSTSDLAAAIGRLDGSRTTDQHLEECGSAQERIDLVELFLNLQQRGLIVACTAGKPDPDPVLERQRLFWGRKAGFTGLQDSGASTARSLTVRTVGMVGQGLFGQVVGDLLDRVGCNVVESVWLEKPLALSDDVLADVLARSTGLDLLVLALRDESLLSVGGLNRWAVENEVAVLVSNDNGHRLEFGPLVVPGDSACAECVRVRGSAASPTSIEDHLEAEMAQSRADGLVGERLSSATVGAGFVVGEIERFLTAIARPLTVNTVYTFDLLTGEFNANRVLRVPRCGVCGPRTSRLVRR